MSRRSTSLAALLVAASAMAACADDGSDTATSGDGGSARLVTTTAAPATSAPAATDATTDTTTSDSTASGAATTAPAATAGTSPPATTPATAAATAPPTEPPEVDPVPVRFEEIARLERPLDLAWRAGDARLFVVEQPGRVTAVDPATGATATALDITDRTVIGGNEQGLLGMVFAPEGDRAYVNYTDLGGDTVIAEYPVTADGGFDAGAERVLLRVDQPYRNHNGGDLAIGPDGLLYLGLGDGGSAEDPERRAMDLSTHLGKLLRIDPQPDAPAGYVVPDDNPYVGVDGALPEIFAIGLRNPWKFTFDPETGDLWIGDVGQDRMEEVDFVPAPGDGSVAGSGLNFGWSAFEGTLPMNSDVDGTGAVPPVLTYERDLGCSISGGAPYRGSLVAGLDGDYVYSDYCSANVWALDLDRGQNLRLGTIEGAAITAVVAGPDGELYLTDANGPVRRLVPQ